MLFSFEKHETNMFNVRSSLFLSKPVAVKANFKLALTAGQRKKQKRKKKKKKERRKKMGGAAKEKNNKIIKIIYN